MVSVKKESTVFEKLDRAMRPASAKISLIFLGVKADNIAIRNKYVKIKGKKDWN